MVDQIASESMNLETPSHKADKRLELNPALVPPLEERRWFAVFTIPQHEKSVERHLELREVESFLPTYETVKVWKNRQRMRLTLPLFPTYLFVHIAPCERIRVLQSPGVLQIVGGKQDTIAVSNAEIDFLRSGFRGCKMEPYKELVVGERVRIKSGAMQGIEGTLVRKNNSLRFVLAIHMINQNAAVEVDAEFLEPVKNGNCTTLA
jgi:transcription antitermination factor NusG